MTPELQDEGLIRDALRIVEEARRRGVVLRLMGALAIRVHTPEFSELHRRLSRLGGGGSQFTDVDMVTYRSQREAAHRVFTSLGYRPDRLVMAYFGESRFLYHHPQGLYQIDLFFERLRFSHDLDLGVHARQQADGLRRQVCLLYTSPSPRDLSTSRMPSSA